MLVFQGNDQPACWITRHQSGEEWILSTTIAGGSFKKKWRTIISTWFRIKNQYYWPIKGDDIRKTDDKGRAISYSECSTLVEFGRRRVASSAFEFWRRSRRSMSTMWFLIQKWKKVKAGVLYALLMRWSLASVLPAPSGRGKTDLKERVRSSSGLCVGAIGWKKSDERSIRIHLKSGCSAKKDQQFLHAQAEMNGESYRFMPSCKEKKRKQKSQKEEEETRKIRKAGTETPSEETQKRNGDDIRNSEKD